MAYDTIYRLTCQGINKHEQLGLAYIAPCFVQNLNIENIIKQLTIANVLRTIVTIMFINEQLVFLINYLKKPSACEGKDIPPYGDANVCGLTNIYYVL